MSLDPVRHIWNFVRPLSIVRSLRESPRRLLHGPLLATVALALLSGGCRNGKPLAVLGEGAAAPGATAPVASVPPATASADPSKPPVLAVIPEGTSPKQIKAIADAKLAEGVDAFERSQKDVGLEAVVEGKDLRVKVANRTAAPLVVGSKNLAIILEGSRAPIPFPELLVSFPPQTLQPGEEKVGILPGAAFAGKTKGARIVFSHPSCRPAMALLRDGSR